MWEFPGGEFSRSNLAGAPGETDTGRTRLERSAGFPIDHHQARRHQSENYSDGVRGSAGGTASRQLYPSRGARWIWLSQAGRYPLTAAASRVIQALTAEKSQRRLRPKSEGKAGGAAGAIKVLTRAAAGGKTRVN